MTDFDMDKLAADANEFAKHGKRLLEAKTVEELRDAIAPLIDRLFQAQTTIMAGQVATADYFEDRHRKVVRAFTQATMLIACLLAESSDGKTKEVWTAMVQSLTQLFRKVLKVECSPVKLQMSKEEEEAYIKMTPEEQLEFAAWKSKDRN